jgi:hypothetical protein
MKTKYFLKACLCLFLIALSFSCSKGGGDIIDSLIPNISAATWTNTADANDTYFFFNVTNEGTATSSFDGNENLNGETHGFSGSYQNSKISFTFNDGPKQGTKYTGKINDNSAHATMTLTTPTGTVTLQKQ